MDERFRGEFMKPDPREASHSGTRATPDDYWYRVISDISERCGEKLSTMEVRAHALIRELGIPSGQCSSFEFRPEGTRDTDAERLYSEYVTSPSGVETVGLGIPSVSAIDLSLAEKTDLLRIMDPRAAEIIAVDRREADESPEGYAPLLYFRLLGVDVFVKGITHTPSEKLGGHIRGLTRNASVIAVEGRTNLPYGASLRKHMRSHGQNDDSYGYDALMQDTIADGHEVLFAEIDPRDESKVSFDNPPDFADLPDSFFERYYSYISAENPRLAETIGDAASFRNLLRYQAGNDLGKIEETVDGREYYAHAYIPDAAPDGASERSAVPTGLEFGQLIFSDAFSAVRLHLIAKLMADGKIPKGPIVDFQGRDHLSGKQFFIRYPEYAMEVILRALPEVLAGDASGLFKKGRVGSVGKMLSDPDWERIVRKIGSIAFMKSRYSLEPEPYLVDVFREYGKDSARVMPTDADIALIIARSEKSRNGRNPSEDASPIAA